MHRCLIPNKEYDDLHYSEDILGDRFQKRVLHLEDGHGGEEIATLVRRIADCHSDENLDPSVQKAVLYVHGFNDYFFQKEAAYKFNEKGYNFYALDLRRCGRSYQSNQKFNQIHDLRTYHEEILEALQIIYLENNQEVILFGHSLGGLVLTLFAKDYTNDDLFDGLILNSPFFNFNTQLTKKTFISAASMLGSGFPNFKMDSAYPKEYGISIHKNNHGEWDYNLEWKRMTPPKMDLGWVRAVHKGQEEIREIFQIHQPVLVMCAGESLFDLTQREKIHCSDIILNVQDISAISRNIKGDVDIVPIEGGVHDLLLSKENVRKKVYSTMFGWLLKYDFL
ncbi:MAG: alpha/beta hydrolase [Methanosarcinales archaeon]|jgi:alpha-beta hydrolase superfamily lysophospholipase|nr:alpha/beta hydrolase [Methanosarcinales archaeon]